jgi:hypothetical protein
MLYAKARRTKTAGTKGAQCKVHEASLEQFGRRLQSPPVGSIPTALEKSKKFREGDFEGGAIVKKTPGLRERETV